MKSRKKLQPYTVAELFSGCGGFSHGFWRTGRFRVVFGNDLKKFALRTFEFNHTYDGIPPAVLPNDIRKVSEQEIIEMLEHKGISNLDCLIGGPPCQGFSQMRRSEDRKGSRIVRFGGYNKLDQDPRNDLVLRFLEIAAALNPKVIVIENVPQFLSHYHDGKKGGIAQQVEEMLVEMGYPNIVSGVMNAADYGVPQFRLRAVIMASRAGRITLPVATHSDPELISLWNRKPWVTVREALEDLPHNPPFNESCGGCSLELYRKNTDSPYAKMMRTSETFPFNHVMRRYQTRIIEIIRNMKPGETWDDASRRLRKRFDALVTKLRQPGESEKRARSRLSFLAYLTF